MIISVMLMLAGGHGSMTETLYLDLFFLVNLFADLYLLFLTGMILREPVRRRKGQLFLGAAVGAAVGCVLVFFPKLPLPVWILLELAIPALLMTQVAFGRCSLLETLRRVTVLGLTAVLSGGVFAALEATKRAWELTPWTFREFGLALSAAGGMLLAGMVILKNGITLRNSLYEVTLHYQGKQKTVLALLDTGNQLYEPYGHQPVHILEKNAWPELPEPVFKVIYIPFCSVGNEHGILPAVRMERMEVRQRGEKIRVLEHPWVAISETPLSVRHQYEMLLHGE